MSSFDMFGFFAPKENILPKEKKKFVCEPLVFADSVIIKEDLEKLSGYNSKCKVEKQTERLAQELSNDESNELDDQVPNHLVPPSEYENYKKEIIQGDKKNSEWLVLNQEYICH